MKSITYKQSGVDIDKANKLIVDIKRSIGTTRNKGSVDKIGGFSGLFNFAAYKVENPLLVASTDGVGTKVKIAQLVDKHDTVGIDLVAMSVNDLLCCGAKPLFFLDYFATGKLNGRIWKSVLKGIVNGCKQSECSLLGGETAEMPGMYKGEEYDLAGFAVGIVDKKKVIDGRNVKEKDVVLGLASSGFHSNGYSLVRKVFSEKELKKKPELFLKPTIIYVKAVLDLVKNYDVKSIAHITGGGFYDNIPRVIPKGFKVIIDKNSWEKPVVFNMVSEKARIPETELYRTLNMGIGMAIVLPRVDAIKAVVTLRRNFKLKSWIIGRIEKGKHEVVMK